MSEAFAKQLHAVCNLSAKAPGSAEDLSHTAAQAMTYTILDIYHTMNSRDTLPLTQSKNNVKKLTDYEKLVCFYAFLYHVMFRCMH